MFKRLRLRWLTHRRLKLTKALHYWEGEVKGFTLSASLCNGSPFCPSTMSNLSIATQQMKKKQHELQLVDMKIRILVSK